MKIKTIFSLLLSVASFNAIGGWGDSQINGATAKSTITIKTCSKFAGAICSLTWSNKEFIDIYDHGRELQSAAQFYFPPDSGQNHPETYNPTEAGTKADGTGSTSSSNLVGLHASGNILQTGTFMAFYLAPNGYNHLGQPVQNTTVLSDYKLNKTVKIGILGVANVIEYRTQYTIPTNENPSRGVFEPVAAYLTSEFSRFYTYDVEGRKVIVEYTGEIIGQNLPVILSNGSQSHALGIYTPDSQQSYSRVATQNAKRHDGIAHPTMKFNSVFRINDLPSAAHPIKQFHFVSYLAVGTLSDVKIAMDKIHTNLQ